MDIMVVCVNNFIYGMTGGQAAPTTPQPAITSTTPHGAFEPPFSLPHLLEACGAVYVARWTSLHVRRLTRSLTEALGKPGFSFVEVVTPCSTLYARRNRLGSGFDLMNFYHDHSQVERDCDTTELAIEYQQTIKVGKFVDIERPTWHELSDRQHLVSLGDKYYRATQMDVAQQEEKTNAPA
jgi:2-oxoglutarate ferredoxin oxidoreductase subunit beta